MNILKVFIFTFISFLAIDLVWLGVLAKDIYQKHIGFLLAPKPNWVAAIVFYLLYVAGVLFFASYPAYKTGLVKNAVIYGALLGLLTYGTYDLTNLAVLKNWPLQITIIDLIWGTFLTASVSYFGFLFFKMFF